MRLVPCGVQKAIIDSAAFVPELAIIRVRRHTPVMLQLARKQWNGSARSILMRCFLLLAITGEAICASELKKPSFVRSSMPMVASDYVRHAVTTMHSSGDSNSTSSGLLLDGNERDELVDAIFIAETNLPTDLGHFRLRAYRVPRNSNEFIGTEPCVIYGADKPPFGIDGKLAENVPLRVHDQCFTSEVFRSKRCDCKEQLKKSLLYIQTHGGAIIYLQQEGRGIGLANKIAAYALQDKGFDTVDANVHLGLPEDCRQYGVVPSILRDMNIKSIQLITNNPQKVDRLTYLGVKVSNTLPMVVKCTNPYNRRYLETKRSRMNHANLDVLLSTCDGVDNSTVE